MKKIKILLIITLGLLAISSMAADTLYVRFNNYYVADGGANPDTMIFDVEYKSFTTGTYIMAFQTDIQFNSSVFGTNAVPVEIIPYTIAMGGLVSDDLNFASGPTNPSQARFRYGKRDITGPYTPASLGLVPTASWGKLIKYKMLILDNTQSAGLQFINLGGMKDNQKFVKVVTSLSTNYIPLVLENNLINFPTTPTNFDLMISEVADPTGSNNDFVEIYNAGSTTVDFTGAEWFLTTYDGVTYSDVQLTGTVVAGQSYVVGGTAYSYSGKPANQISAVVDGSGTLSHYLSMYDPYNDGLWIDYYGGAGTTYTGGHGVRLYTVTAPTTTFNAAEWSILLGSAQSMTPGSHRQSLTWQGDVNSDWLNNDNWTNSYIPDAGHLASIQNAGETLPVIDFGDNAAAYNLTIGGGVSGLTILSDETNGDGSLVTYGTFSGIATVQRFLDADRYYYITKPATTANAGVFLHCWLFTYNELVNDWDPFIAPESTPLGDMQGYAVWTSSINSYHPNVAPIGDTTVAYVGILNNGPLSKSLTYSIDGWNFTGNPYPSAVDWTAAGWTKTNLVTNAYSVWNGTSYGTYTVGSGGTNGATQFIPAAQGFFVQVSAAGSLGLDNAVRTHAPLDFWKNEELLNNRLSLTISNGQVNDETVIYFNENATEDLDYLYDASKLIASAAPQAYTMMGDRKMAINTYNNPVQTSAVNMGINAPEPGEYTISASNLESFDASTPLFLEDLLTNQYINLRETSSYSFSSEAGMSSRFVVHFTNTQGIGDGGASEVNFIYSYDRNIYVNFNGTRGEICLYNILGQEISRTSASNGMNVIAAPQGNAVYIVKVISDNVSVTKKVFVK